MINLQCAVFDERSILGRQLQSPHADQVFCRLSYGTEDYPQRIEGPGQAEEDPLPDESQV